MASRSGTCLLLVAGFLFGCAGAPFRTGPVADRNFIRFSVEAPRAERVSLVLMKARSIKAAILKVPAEKRHRGIWSASLRLAPGRYRYFFIVDGSITVGTGRGRLERDDFGGVTGVLTVKDLPNGALQVY
ncbi:MAG: hypothetical protein GXP52_04415 [Deltaproteobacteria bacterium]|nr:hypothetical protein [Deltaproteobacteria bacterium]